MLSGLARVAGLLNAIDIEPMLLKGAAHLVEGTYPEPSMRILGDVDILVPVTRSAEAAGALEDAGFGTKSSGVVPPPTHHHLPMLHDPETGLGVELHTDVISRSADAVISTAWFCEMARPGVFRGQRIRLPEPTRNVGHTIFHSEIFHRLYTLDKIELRHLLDVALLYARHARVIDWNELDRRFSDAGLGEVLATYLHFADELLGQPAPKLSHGPRGDAMAKLRSTESRDGFHFQIEVLKRLRDDLQTELSLHMADRDQIKTEAGRLSNELEDANRARAELERKLAGFQFEGERLGAELATANRARAELERTLAAILSSRTWRLTGPLRAVVSASRRWLQ
jgi:hypothetical protein